MLIGVDTGGTFTDFVVLAEGKVKIFKVLSTPENPAEAVVKGLNAVGGRCRRVIHGTTVATNAVLERKGAKTAFITNRGFEDLLLIGRQNREELYTFKPTKPKPLIAEKACFGLNCRINSKGEVVLDLSEEEVIALAEKLKKEGFESAAVSFLFSFLNPEHEEKVKRIIEKSGIPVSASHEIVPEFREFERASTTVVNAYVLPKMKSYISYLEENLKEGDTLRVMQSNGGIISSEKVKAEPVRTVLSGPAGGVVGAWSIGRCSGYTKLITFDMGGTSTDVSLIDGTPTVTTEAKLGGIPVKVPVIDIHTVGAGGGSIAKVDAGGALTVGPESAGADPGPICYGKGEEITVTDANLFARRLDPDCFLGGEMKLDYNRIIPFFEETSKKLGITPPELAEGILKVANAKMERAIKVISVERGYDPKDFVLFTYGGAGGLHAAFLAKSLKIPRVIIPANPGTFSALGMVLADVIKDYSLSVMLEEAKASSEKLEEVLEELKEKAVREMEEEGFSPEEVILESFADVRYKGQSFEITVPYSRELRKSFEKLHRQRYGYVHDREIEVVCLRVRAVGKTEKPELPTVKEGTEAPPEGAFLKEEKVLFEGEWLTTPFFRREKLLAGNRIEGPAVIVEYSSTTVIPPESTATVDPYGNLIVEVNVG